MFFRCSSNVFPSLHGVLMSIVLHQTLQLFTKSV